MKKFIVLGILAMGFAVVSQAQTPAAQPTPTKSCCKKEGAAGCNKPATAAATPTKSCCKKQGAASCSGHATASASSAPAPEPTTAATPVPVSKSDKKK